MNSAQRLGPNQRSIVAVIGLCVAFVVSIAVSRFDPGPGWLDFAGFQHLDAVFIGLTSGVAAALAAAMVLIRGRREAAPIPSADQGTPSRRPTAGSQR